MVCRATKKRIPPRESNTSFLSRNGGPLCWGPGSEFSTACIYATVTGWKTEINVAACHANGSLPQNKARHRSLCQAFRLMPTGSSGWNSDSMFRTLSIPVLHGHTRMIPHLRSVFLSPHLTPPDSDICCRLAMDFYR